MSGFFNGVDDFGEFAIFFDIARDSRLERVNENWRVLGFGDRYKAEVFEFRQCFWNDIDAEAVGGEVDEHDVGTKGFELG